MIRPQWRLFYRFVIRPLFKDWPRNTLTVIGIALGLSVVMAVRLAGDRAIGSFSESLSLLDGDSDFHVRGNGFSMSEEWMSRLSWFWEHGSMRPMVEGGARVEGEGAVRILGLNLLGDGRFEMSGDRSNDALGSERFLDLLRLPNRVVIARSLARRMSLGVGSRFDILVSDRAVEVVVGAILQERGLSEAFGGRLLIMDLSWAQEVLGKIGKLDRIDFHLDDPTHTRVTSRLEAGLAQGLIVVPKGALALQSERVTRSFRLNLNVLSHLALIVGVILIYNAASLSTLMRRREIAVLRAVGSGRRTVLAFFVMESGLLGLAGALLGILIGPVLADQAGAMVGRTVGEFYTGVAAAPLTQNVSPAAHLWLIVLGTSIGMLSALVPAWRATGQEPATVLREGFWRDPGRRSRRPLLCGGALFGLACLALLGPALQGVPWLGYLSAVLFLAAFSLAALPTMLFLLRQIFRMTSRYASPQWRLAIGQLQGGASRVIVAVISLMIAVSMFVGVVTMVGSFRRTVEVWIDQTLVADLFVDGEGSRASGGAPPLTRETLARLTQIEGVEAVGTFFARILQWQGSPVSLAGATFAVTRDRGRLLFVDGRPSAQVLDAAIGGDRVVVSEPFSYRFGVTRGDTLLIPTPGGEQPFVVEGVYYDYSSDRGAIVMDRNLYSRWFGEEGAATAALYLSKEASGEAVTSRIRQALPQARLNIRPNATLKQAALRVFDRTFQITGALELIAIIVAALGVANTLVAVTYERRGEVALLHFLGAFRHQIRRVFLYEAALLGVVGCVLGTLLGSILSLILIYVINRQSFGWTIQLSVPYLSLIQGIMLIFVATVVAGLYPSRLAGRMNALRSLRTG